MSKINNTFSIEDVNDYTRNLTDKQKERLINHCNEFGLKPEICARYDDMEDFYSDWMDLGIGYTKQQARARYDDGIASGEFKRFSDGSIVRLVM